MLNIHLPYDKMIPHQGIYQRKIKCVFPTPPTKKRPVQEGSRRFVRFGAIQISIGEWIIRFHAIFIKGKMHYLAIFSRVTDLHTHT